MSMETLFGLAALLTLLAFGSTLPHVAQHGPLDAGRSYGHAAAGYGHGNQLQAEPPRQFDSGHRHGHGCGHAYNEHPHNHHHQQQHEHHASFNPPQPQQFYTTNTAQGSVLHQPPSSQTFSTHSHRQPHYPLPAAGSAESHAPQPGYQASTGLAQTQLAGNSYNSNPNSLAGNTAYGHRFQPTKPQSQPAHSGSEINTGFQYANPAVQQDTSAANAKTPTIFDQNISEIFNTNENTPLPAYSGHSPLKPKDQTEEIMPESINDRGLFDTPPKCAVDEKAVNGRCRKMV